MKFSQKISSMLFISFALLSCHRVSDKVSVEKEEIQEPSLKTPAEIYGNLLYDIQLSKVFADGKTFVDASPKMSPDSIVKIYDLKKNETDFVLKSFVMEHFDIPKPASVKNGTFEATDPEEHITKLWDVLTRQADSLSIGTRIKLSHPYVVPGGRFQEIYYWDSYFTMLGLQQSGRIDLIEGMVKNFASMIDQFGFIPNGNRTYYLGRSQPPFFFLMVEILAQEKGKEVWDDFLPHLVKEHQYWMSGSDRISKERMALKKSVLLENNHLMTRYWDMKPGPRDEMLADDVGVANESDLPKQDVFRHLRSAAESGWDFSSRWFGDGKNLETIETTNIIPVDLNSLLFGLESRIASIYKNKNEEDEAMKFETLALSRKEGINRFCWSEEEQFYSDYNFLSAKQTNRFSLAAVFPLCFKIASDKQAQEVVKKIKEDFLKPGGVVTSLYKTGQQWDAPNGWAPLQWMTVWGLRNYGYDKLADEISRRWVGLNEAVFARTKKMMEKYNVGDLTLEAGGGEYDLQDGFGWTNGVYLRLKSDLDKREYSN